MSESTTIWGIAALVPSQKPEFEAHCTGDCGKISMGGVIDDPVTGGLFVCSEPICPHGSTLIENYGKTNSFGRPHTVHLRALGKLPEPSPDTPKAQGVAS